MEKEEGPPRDRWRRFRPNPYMLVLALGVIVLLVIIVSVILTLKKEDKLSPSKPDRIACPGTGGREECEDRSCHYERTERGPNCFMEKDEFAYWVVESTQEPDGPLMQLRCDTLETPYGVAIENVDFKVTYLTENIIRFQFKDSDNDRYEVPVQEHFPLLRSNGSSVDNSSQLAYEFQHVKDSDAFHFKIDRRSDGTTLWDTRLGALVLSDQYLQIGSYLPSENVYGIGEQVHDSLRHSMDYKSWPMFARDAFPKAHADGQNLYGVHPFYMCLEKSGKSHGVLFLNSNAMDVTFMPAPAVTFRTIGGILDFFVFVGNGPEHVVRLYTSLVGRPMMPPYWSLGFQLSRWGYNTMGGLKRAIERTRKASIPQAVQYLDIDHLDENKDFTYDDKHFPNLLEYIEETREKQGLKWIVIVDPALPAEPDYAPYSSGLQRSVFVKRAAAWKPTMFPEELEKPNVTYGKVWPKSRAAFPDFFLNSTKQWWKEVLIEYHKNISYDGLWIDMNEPANFATDPSHEGFCEYNRDDEYDSNGRCWGMRCPESPLEDPPYNPVLKIGDQRLSLKTLCMESVQGGDAGVTYKHYDVHSLYGWSQTLPTVEAAQEATGTRSLVISRSTYPSSGQFSGHWLGDNSASFDDMRRSIIGMLEFNMFGIPYVGADVCGFLGHTDPDLCMRWMQLGAFYPFYRNHNGMDYQDQDPASFSAEVTSASRRAVERRLSLNPYLYTLFYRAHVNGGTVVRPLFHEYPRQEMTWDMSDQFMWGRSLLVAPILAKGHKGASVYLPEDEWWLFKEKKSKSKPPTRWYVMERDSDDTIPMYVRGGTVLPYEKYNRDTYNASSNYRNISLYVFPKKEKANGELFMDDGVSKDTIENDAYALYKFNYANCSLKIVSQEMGSFGGVHPVLEEVVVFKVKDIARAGNHKVSTTRKKNMETDEEIESVVITVNTNMKEVTDITWEDAGGGCSMFP